MGQNKSKTVHRVTVCTPGGEEVPVHLCDSKNQFKTMTVKQLKEKIEQNTAVLSGFSGDIRLICGDKSLEGDSKLLCEHGVTRKSIIQMVHKEEGGKSEEGEGEGISDNKREAGTSAGVEKRGKGEKMVKIQVLAPRFSEKMLIVLFNKKEMKEMTVNHLKEKIKQKIHQIKGQNVRVHKVRFNGKELEEDSLLTDHGIKHMSTVEADADFYIITCGSCAFEDYRDDQKRLSIQMYGDFEEPFEALKN